MALRVRLSSLAALASRLVVARPSVPYSATMSRQSPIELPPLNYCTTPLTWPQLQAILGAADFAKLTRSVAQQTDYELYKRDLQQTWRSVTDHVLVEKLGLARRTDSATGLWYAEPGLADWEQIRTVLVKNDFPYCMAEGVEHWILWKLGGDISDQEIAKAKVDLESALPDVEDTLHWVNPPHLKSLPEIDHVHILVLRSGTAGEDLPN